MQQSTHDEGSRSNNLIYLAAAIYMLVFIYRAISAVLHQGVGGNIYAIKHRPKQQLSLSLMLCECIPRIIDSLSISKGGGYFFIKN